jgi:hypothetical protein
MKKWFSILFICTLVFNTFGYFVWYSVSKYNIREEAEKKIREGINEAELSLIVIKTSDLSTIDWTKENKEFRYNGEMYDIVRMEIKGGSVHYYCFKDREEKQLIAQFIKSETTKKETDKKLVKFFNFQFYQDIEASKNALVIWDMIYTERVDRPLSRYLDSLSPPPELS